MANVSKQDRHGARTTAELEQRYSFGKNFSQVMGVANDARENAKIAAEGIEGLDQKLDSDEIFARLTNNGEAKGIFKVGNEIYINASYLVTGIIKSPDGKSVVIDLDNGTAKLTGEVSTLKVNDALGLLNYATLNPSGVMCIKESDTENHTSIIGGGSVAVLSSNGEQGTMNTKGVAFLNAPLSSPDCVASMEMYPSSKKAEIHLRGGAGATDLKIVSTQDGNSIIGVDVTDSPDSVVNKAYVDALEARVAALEAMLATS